MRKDVNQCEDVSPAAVEIRFPDIQRILDEAVEGEDFAQHGPFWRNTTRDEFVAKRVFGCQIIFSDNGTFDGPRSPLVQILQSSIECPVGLIPPRERPQMPFGFPPMPAEKVQIISDWIDAQCPA